MKDTELTDLTVSCGYNKLSQLLINHGIQQTSFHVTMWGAKDTFMVHFNDFYSSYFFKGIMFLIMGNIHVIGPKKLYSLWLI